MHFLYRYVVCFYIFLFFSVLLCLFSEIYEFLLLWFLNCITLSDISSCTNPKETIKLFIIKGKFLAGQESCPVTMTQKQNKQKNTHKNKKLKCYSLRCCFLIKSERWTRYWNNCPRLVYSCLSELNAKLYTLNANFTPVEKFLWPKKSNRWQQLHGSFHIFPLNMIEKNVIINKYECLLYKSLSRCLASIWGFFNQAHGIISLLRVQVIT